MATPVLDIAILWKVQYILDECVTVGRELAEASSKPGAAEKIPGLARRLAKYDQELKDVLGSDKRKAWDAVKANLEGSIEKQQGLLATTTDGDSRLAYEREIERLQKALDGLTAEGRPQ